MTLIAIVFSAALSRRRFAILVVLLAGAGCGFGLGGLGNGGGPRYQVRRSGRVLPPMPSMRSGAPMEATTELAASTGVVTSAEPNHHDSGDRVPRTWLEAALRQRVVRHFDIAALGAVAPPSPSIRVSDSDMPSVDQKIPFALGAGLRTPFGTGRGLNVGLGFDFLYASLPVAQAFRCYVDCLPGSEEWTSWTGRVNTAVVRLGIVPTWVGERVSWFAGASLRTEPWVARENAVYGRPRDADIEVGWSTVLAAGTEVALGDRLRLLAAVAQPMGDPGADVGPLVSIGLAARVGAATAGSP